MNFAKLNLVLFATAVALIFSACELREQPDYQTLASDASITENVSNDVFNVVDNESKNGQHSGDIGGKTGVFTYLSAVDTCAQVTLEISNGWPYTLTIDFGSGCTDNLGVTRKGKVIGVFTAPYRDSGSVVTVTFDNYFVNDHQVEGTKTITNNGTNNNGNLSFTVRDINGLITKPDGGKITWSSTRTNEWIAGESTLLNFCDDTYSITGSAEGTVSSGDTYRLDVDTDPLIKKVCCRWVSDGSITYTINGSQTATIDYGSGTCDPSATLAFEGQTFTILVQ